MSTINQIDAMLALCARATPGPVAWQRFGDKHFLTGQYGQRPIIIGSVNGHVSCLNRERVLLEPMRPDHPDAQFYAASRTGWEATLRALKVACKALGKMNHAEEPRAKHDADAALTKIAEELEAARD